MHPFIQPSSRNSSLSTQGTRQLEKYLIETILSTCIRTTNKDQINQNFSKYQCSKLSFLTPKSRSIDLLILFWTVSLRTKQITFSSHSTLIQSLVKIQLSFTWSEYGQNFNLYIEVLFEIVTLKRKPNH